MMNFTNNLVLTTLTTLFFTVIVFASPISNVQQLNQVRAYIAPATSQKSYFPSAQQVQEALAPRAPKTEQQSSFPPLEQQPQAFINQFSTPDAPRTTPVAQFVTPDLIVNDTAMPQKYDRFNRNGYPQQAMKFPATPRSAKKANSFPPQGFANSSMGKTFPSNFGSGNNGNPFSFPNAFPNAFPAMPFSNNHGLNPMADLNNWNGMENGFPLMPKTTRSNRKQAWGDKRNIWPNFYANFTDNAWDETISAPRNLERTPSGWLSPYISTPDPVSDAITNQFPPIAAHH